MVQHAKARVPTVAVAMVQTAPRGFEKSRIGVNANSSGMMYSIFAKRKLIQPVFQGSPWAIDAATNAPRQTGGVMLESCDSQKTIRCAAITATPSCSKAGPARTTSTR